MPRNHQAKKEKNRKNQKILENYRNCIYNYYIDTVHICCQSANDACTDGEVDMRKKSHISLAWYLMNSEGMGALKSHKGSFYMGSILPDCVPSFLVRRHTIEDSFEVLQSEFQKLVSHFDPQKGITCYFCRHLGVIIHYISDYFTFPHNAHYPGNLRDHCIYEEELKKELRAYVHSPEAMRHRAEETFQSPEEILAFVRRAHDTYKRAESMVKRDCRYIIELCHRVVDAVLSFLTQMPVAEISVAMQ